VSCKSKEELAALFADDAMRPRRRQLPPSTPGHSSVSHAQLPPPLPPPGCPPDREEIGRSTWTLLHTIAAYFPDQPTPQEKAAALGVIEGLRLLFPCSHCRAQLSVDLEKLPPEAGSRAELSRWVCQQHNLVNEALGEDGGGAGPAGVCVLVQHLETALTMFDSLQASLWCHATLAHWIHGGELAGPNAGAGQGRAVQRQAT